MKLRVSLKLLLLFVTVATLFFSWRARPRMVASGFRRAVAARDFERADGYLTNPGEYAIWGQGETYRISQATVQFEDMGFAQLLRGNLSGELVLEYRPRTAAASADSYPQANRTLNLVATPSGVEIVGQSKNFVQFEQFLNDIFSEADN